MIINGKTTAQGISIACAVVLLIASLFVLNFILPLSISPFPFDHFSNLSSRIWAWLEYAVGIAAAGLVIHYRSSILERDIVQAIVLASLNWIGRYTMNSNSRDATPESIITALAFIAAVVIFRKIDQDNPLHVEAFHGSLPHIFRGILFGIAAAIPFAGLNIAYFWFTCGPGHPGSLVQSFTEAFHPGISEEIIYRFFIISLCLLLLNGRLSQRLLIFITMFLAVIPHSLAHLPDLMLINPGSAVFLLLTTSLLFGLPMALLQTRYSLESAISFHWFIDFTRFFLGF